LRQVAKHPDFHADAPRTRTRSIDLPLIKLAEPLPSEFAAPPLADASRYLVDTPFDMAGYDLSREGDEKTSGVLRVGRVKLRAPLSSGLLWLEGADGEIGACTGDSGGPVFTSKGELAGIIAFAEGRGSAPLRGIYTSGADCSRTRLDGKYRPEVAIEVNPGASSIAAKRLRRMLADIGV
jgi:hypothetical protein